MFVMAPRCGLFDVRLFDHCVFSASVVDAGSAV